MVSADGTEVVPPTGRGTAVAQEAVLTATASGTDWIQ
jgi:hypothetical protein